MRIYIDGKNETAKGLFTTLSEKTSYAVRRGRPTAVTLLPHIVFTVVEANVPEPRVDSVDSDLERQVVNHIAALTPSGRLMIQHQGGNQNDRVIVLTVPPTDAERDAVTTGIIRALHTVFKN